MDGPHIILIFVKASILYDENLRLLKMGVRRVIDQGGQWSGKTVNILGALATLCSEEEGDDAGVTTVTSMSMPHLKGGALRDFEMYVMPSFKASILSYHKTDHKVTFRSGSIMEFKVFEDEMAARGQKRKRLFVNEANKFSLPHFFEMDSRSEQTVIDYNPSIRFWAHTEYIGKPGNVLLISDHRHNPFLKPEKHAEIEAYKGERFKVYSRGLTGNIEGVIFPNWTMIDDEDFPKNQEWIFSIDFGYTIDPTAIIKHCRIGKKLYIKELSYEPGISSRRIIEILNENGYKDGYTPLYCEHDADMIHELRKYGASYADFARKGQGSIKAGIRLLNEFDVYYTNSSQNLHREISMYVWEIDKETGLSRNVPQDKHNHCFDSIRYGVYSSYLKKHETT